MKKTNQIAVVKNKFGKEKEIYRFNDEEKRRNDAKINEILVKTTLAKRNQCVSFGQFLSLFISCTS